MDEADAREHFVLIAGLLREGHLGWIVDQAEETIARGNLISKSVDTRPMTLDQNSGDYRPTGSRSSAEMAATLPYNARESLKILIDAIALSASELGAMEATTVDFAIRHNLSRIEFFEDDHKSADRIIESTATDEDRKWSDVLRDFAKRFGEQI